MSDGTHEVLFDSGHVLDAGGFNPGNCNEAESQTWRAVGAAAGPFS
jgi:hypothetical protein